MDLMTMLEELENEFESAKTVPLSNKKMIDIDDFLGMIDNLKIAVPDEIKQSKLILERETYIIEDAKRNAELVVAEAEQTARALIDEHEIVRRANERAEEIIDAARNNAQEIRDGVMNYAGGVLRSLESDISRCLDTVRENINEFNNSNI